MVSLPLMRRLTSISLLLLIGTLLVPWQELCVAHPLGHKPHPPGEHSACELHKMYKSDKPAFFPPMHCKHVSEVVGAFQLPQHEQAKVTFQTLAVAAVVFDFLPSFQDTENECAPATDERCNSGPPLPANVLRGPPFS
ncbi:MAG: hypothetical protein EPO28_00790 [Saprospiraceae bacterium]|nr:MAG: hypothetical protein EPO28_00790 [Saprospiraceae bacterium]